MALRLTEGELVVVGVAALTTVQVMRIVSAGPM